MKRYFTGPSGAVKPKTSVKTKCLLTVFPRYTLPLNMNMKNFEQKVLDCTSDGNHLFLFFADDDYSKDLEMTCFEPYRNSLDALIEAFDVCLRSVSTPAASQSDNQAVARFCLLVLEYTKWRVAATAVGSSAAANIISTSTSSADDGVAVEGLVFSALKSVGRALGIKEVVACVSDATATALVIALSDLLDAKLDCHSVPVEMCPIFKSAFEKGEETPLMFACVKINSLFTSRLKLDVNMRGGSRSGH